MKRHLRIQLNLRKELKKKGFEVDLEKRVNGKKFDVWAENEKEIVIYEVVITSDRIFEKHIRALRSKKPVRFFKVYPVYSPKPSPKWADRKTITLQNSSYYKLREIKAGLKFDTWEDLVDFLVTPEVMNELKPGSCTVGA